MRTKIISFVVLQCGNSSVHGEANSSWHVPRRECQLHPPRLGFEELSGRTVLHCEDRRLRHVEGVVLE